MTNATQAPKIARPFVLVTEQEAAPPSGSERMIVDRERSFFRNIGLGGLGGGPHVMSTTYSGEPSTADDSAVEDIGDYCDSPGPILV